LSILSGVHLPAINSLIRASDGRGALLERLDVLEIEVLEPQA
jgi:hypothetical protein